MSIFLQIVIALAGISVMFGVFWFVYGTLRTPVRFGKGAGVNTVVSVRDKAEGLEQTLDGLIWLRENGALDAQILIADCGMDEEGRALAGQAVKKYGKIAICKAEDVRQWIVETG